MNSIRIRRCAFVAGLMILVLGLAGSNTWAQLPSPNQPVLVVQDNGSTDPYQNFVPELLRTEGINNFQTAQLGDLTQAFLANYDVVILPHLALTAGQAGMFSNYVNAGGTLAGFRPDLQLADVFGVAPLGGSLSEAWLKIDTSTAYGAGLDSAIMRFHGSADLYSLNGATALANLYISPNSPTVSPAAAVYSFGAGKAILFSFDLAQSIVLMRQGNPAWAGFPNNHDGYGTMRPSQMFMDQNTGQFWNDLGDGALNDVPQADIQMRLFSNALVLTNAAKRPLPRLWYFPNQNRAILLMTGDHHGDDASNSINETNAVQAAGGKFTNFLWDPFGTFSSSQVNDWLAAGHAMEIHFNDTAEVDGTGVAGSAASWAGMQNVMNTALADFAANYPAAPAPITTRQHFLIWVSRNANGDPDQTAQAKLYQNAGIQLDTTYSAFPNRWGYMTGSGLPMKFLDTTTGQIIPVFEQATLYEDDIQLSSLNYSTQWDLPTAKTHYERSLSDSLTKYNTVISMLFHPDHWSDYQDYAQTVLQYAQAHSIPMLTTRAWLQFWKDRAATAISMPLFASNTLSFSVTGSPQGLTLLVPLPGEHQAVSSFAVDGTAQNFTIAPYQGVTYASVVLGPGAHTVAVTFTLASKIQGHISPSAAVGSATIQVQGPGGTVNVTPASDGSYWLTLANGTYTLTPQSSGNYIFAPSSRTITVNSADLSGLDFLATNNPPGQTLFTTQTPAVANISDGVNYELGTAFTSDAPGLITAIRFWKDQNESGVHVGKIWSGDGTLLASVTFTNETAVGWQEQSLPTPLNIAAGTVYVVSVNTGGTFYVATRGELSSQIVNGHLSSVVGNNGLFGPAGQFPVNTFNGTNYYRDIFFVPGISSRLASVTLNPDTVVAGMTSTGTVTLSNPAPAGGAEVTLSSDSSLAAVPSSVIVPAGASSANFTVNTSSNGTITTANILGSYNGFQSAVLTINGLSLSSLSLNPSSVAGGGSVTGTAILTSAAPAGGISVTLSADNARATLPGSVTVPEGATGATFTVGTSAVGAATVVTVTGNYNGSRSATFTITPPVISAIAINPAEVTGGASATGTITLSSAAPAEGAEVQLSSSDPAAAAPATVTIAGGQTSGDFQIATTAVPSNTSVTITGSYNGTATGTLMIDAPTVAALSVNPNTVIGGSQSTGTVTLNSAAPAGGAAVALSSDNPAASVPATVTVAQGATGATFAISTTPLGTAGAAQITASYHGSQSTTLNIAATAVLSVSLNPADIIGGASTTGTVTLNGPAPDGGAVVSLTTDTSAASAPASVTVSPGATSAAFSVASTPVANTVSATLTASYNGTQTASLTIHSPALNSIVLSPAVILGSQTASGTVTLTGPAPAGGAVVSLASDNAAASVPGNVLIPEGASAANFPVNTLSLNSQQVANISASYSGIKTATLTIEADSIAGLALAPDVLAGGNSSIGTVTLAAPAPQGGVVAMLSHDHPPVSAIEGVFSLSGLPQAGVIDWSGLGTSYSFVNSGTAVPIPGQSGANLILSTATGLPMQILTNCSFGGDCGWYGNFADGASVLWMNGTYYSDTGWWAPNSPLTIQFSTPQRGVGFQMMGDEFGPFTATLCAYNASDTLLGCVPFKGTGNGTADNSAAFVGLYDDAQEISRVTVDGGGLLYAHDFGMSSLYVTAARRPIVPDSVTIPAGATSANFPIHTSAVSAPTSVNITAAYNGAQNALLTINPPALSSIALDPDTVTGGAALTGTATLNGTAPAGGVTVALSANNPVSTGMQPVSDPTGMPHDGSVNWTDFGTPFTPVNSGSSFPVAGIQGLNVTTTTSNGMPSMILLACPAPADCGWSGNFIPAAPLLWAGGNYENGNWVANGPLTITLSSPQRGIGFNVMADENGAFSGTLCAYNSNDALLGCVPFSGNGAPFAGGTNGFAAFAGVYSDTPEIAKVVVDAGGVLYPHDFAISNLYVTATRRMVPASVKIQAGSNSATFPVNTDTVSEITSVTISGDYNATQTATLTVNPPALASVTVEPGTVLGGSPATGTITLARPASAPGAAITLASDNPAASVPQTVMVPTGATSATFTITTVPVGSAASATIQASYGGLSRTAVLTIAPSVLSAISLSPASLYGGQSSTGTVTLNGPAPASGAVISLSSSDPAATVPASVTVSGGATSAEFTATTVSVGSQTVATITGTYNGSQAATLTIQPWAVASVSLNPDNVVGGVSSTGTIALSGPAPAGGAVVNLASDNGSAIVPANVTVPAGATTASFGVQTAPVASPAQATITASYNGTAAAVLTINPPAVLSVALNPASVIGGNNSTGTVTLTGQAPVGGAVVMLSSDNSAATVPASVTIPAGQTAADFAIGTTAVGTSATVTISGSYNGVRSASLTINAPVLASIDLSPSSLTGGSSSTATVTLSSAAPAGGAAVALTSDNAAAGVPASVTVVGGATTATFNVTTTAVSAAQAVHIAGTYNGTQSATLTINPPVLASLALNPASLTGGNSSSGNVTLNGPAPSGGAMVVLSSNNGAASVPASVTIPPGASAANFTVTTSGVASPTLATISGSYNGTQSADLTITPAALAGVSMNPAAVTGGTSTTGTVTLTGAAPDGGITVALSNDSASATAPASVTVPAGSSSATFTVTTAPVGNTATVTVTAVYNGVTKTTTFLINPPSLTSVTMNPAAVTGGVSSTGTVTLNGPAPSGGSIVSLSGNNAAATTPASVTVAAGTTTANFTVTTTPVSSATAVTITGTYNGTQNATLTVNPPAISSVSLNPASLIGGNSSAGTVTLNGAAATGGVTVLLSSDNSAATVPASVVVAAGTTSATFTATTAAVGTLTVATITGNYNGSQTATLTINPPVISNLTVNPTSVAGGNSATGTVTLSSAAPAGGAVVGLSSNNSAASVPNSVTVSAGATAATFPITTSGVSSSVTATITGTFNGTRTANLTITPAALSSVTMNPAAVPGGNSSTGTVNLTGAAPAGGISVSLSDNSANAVTPASVTVPAGASSATFTVTTNQVSSTNTVTITAIYNGVTKTATLTINPPAVASVSLNPAEITGSQTTTGTVTLDSPALAGGSVVALSSSNNSNATVPASVTVAAGATTANFTVNSSSVASTTNVTITATLNGSKTAILKLDPPQIVSLSLNPATVRGGFANSIATVTLNAPATGNNPARTISLSSSNTAAATVPPTVIVSSGSTSVQFTVTSKVVLANTTSTITATFNGSSKNAVLTVTP